MGVFGQLWAVTPISCGEAALKKDMKPSQAARALPRI
jgi:hypothetical protein